MVSGAADLSPREPPINSTLLRLLHSLLCEAKDDTGILQIAFENKQLRHTGKTTALVIKFTSCCFTNILNFRPSL